MLAFAGILNFITRFVSKENTLRKYLVKDKRYKSSLMKVD